MKWLVLILCIARYAEGGALRICEDASCSNEEFFEERPVVISTDGEKETVISEAECLPRSEWESNCHLCHCNEYGLARCTRMETCLQGEYAVPLRCKPNTTFTRDCNTCECLESGLDHCTLEDCHQSTMPKRSELVAGKECAPGTFWRSQCNECGCSPKGYPFCTEKACIGPESFEPEMRCAPDTMWLNECNTCWCITSGRAMCTLMGCVSETLYHAESPEIKVEPEGDKIEVSQKETETQNKQTEPDFEKEEEDTSKEIVEDKESAEVNSDHSIEELDYALMDFDRNLQDATIYEDNSNHLEDIDTIKDITHNVLKRSVCKPNQEFLLECNPCKCAPDGQSYTCTQNECMEGEKNKEVEVFMESEGIDHVEKHSVCKPRDTFYIGCNICHCNQFGTDYSCTNKPCPLPKDVEIFHELKAKKSKNETREVVCVANRMFIKDCNTCWCNEDGTGFFCTRKVCVPEFPEQGTAEEIVEGLRILKKDCRPDEVFELDCNTCRCNSDGKSFSCTRRACVEPVDESKNTSVIRKTRATQELTKACQPGKEFRMDCNTCLCTSDGQDYSCTRNDCAQQNGNNGGIRSKRDTSESVEKVSIDCVPESVFDKECNVCRCTADGHHAMCTVKRCKADNAQDNDVNAPDAADPNFRCNPGEQFKRDCNDCSCSADGKSVFCTVRLCDITTSN